MLAAMEVANFHSALTHTTRSAESQWLTCEATKNFSLVLPDGTSLKFDVKVKDSSGLQSSDYILITIWMNHKLIEHAKSNGSVDAEKVRLSRSIAKLLDPNQFPLAIQCQPPKPKYKTAEEEPDDNSATMRASRYANAQIDMSKTREAALSPEQLIATVWVQLYVMMSLLPGEEAFNVVLGHQAQALDVATLLCGAGLAIRHPLESVESNAEGSIVLCPRAAFWQASYPFRQSPWTLSQVHAGPASTGLAYPPTYKITNNIHHPQRPPKSKPSNGPLYTRHVLELGETLTFEVASSKDDAFVTLFTEWHNSDRVNAGWRQRGTKEEQRRYLERVEQSEGTIGLVGKWDGQPWGYVEIYWVKESNIGPYYDSADYDRGFHALVGEERFRGPHRVRTWMGSLIHLIFVLDARTHRVLLEPRASNRKMINYAQMCGGHVEKVSVRE